MDVARQKTDLPINKWVKHVVEENTFKILNFYELLSNIRSVDQSMKLRILLFDAEKERGLFKNFLKTTGIPKIKGIQIPDNKNVSDTIITSELYRRYCLHFKKRISK